MNSNQGTPSDNANLDRTLQTLCSDLTSALDRSPKEPSELRTRLRYVARLLADAGRLPESGALVYRKPGQQVGVVPVGDQLVVGRGRGCGLRILDDPEVGRQHFRIFRQGDAFMVEDLHSLNGTFVNNPGERIERRRLRSGDILLAGNMIFVFVGD